MLILTVFTWLMGTVVIWKKRRYDKLIFVLFCFVFLIDGECVRYRLSMTVFFCSFS